MLAIHKAGEEGGCTLFYAGLLKEVSASSSFLGQGSSSCAKTLI